MERASKVGLTRSTFGSALILLAQKTKVIGDELPIAKEISGGQTSTFATATSFITTIVGASILGFPALFGRGGWYVSPVMLMLCCWLSVEIGYAIEYSIQMILKRADEGEIYSFTRPERYEDICEAALGWKGRTFAAFCVNAFMLALCGAYMILIGQCLEYVIDKAFWSPYRACVLATSLLFVPLTLIDDMSFIARLTVLGMVASVVYGLSIGIGGLQAGLANPNVTYQWVPEKATDLGNVISVMFLGFTYQMVAAPLRAEMIEPAEMPSAVNIALAVVTVVYGVAGALGYYGWGSGENGTEGNILRSMRTEDGRMWAGIALAVAVIMNLFVTFPIFMSVVGRALESAVFGRYSPISRLVLLALAFSVALFVPYFLEFLGLLGSVLGVMVGVF